MPLTHDKVVFLLLVTVPGAYDAGVVSRDVALAELGEELVGVLESSPSGSRAHSAVVGCDALDLDAFDHDVALALGVRRRLGQALAVLLFVVVAEAPARTFSHHQRFSEIPARRSSRSLLEVVARRPAERLDLVEFEVVAAVVAGAVFDEADEAARLAEEVEDQLGDLDVGALVVRADVVRLAGLRLRGG